MLGHANIKMTPSRAQLMPGRLTPGRAHTMLGRAPLDARPPPQRAHMGVCNVIWPGMFARPGIMYARSGIVTVRAARNYVRAARHQAFALRHQLAIKCARPGIKHEYTARRQVCGPTSRERGPVSSGPTSHARGPASCTSHLEPWYT